MKYRISQSGKKSRRASSAGLDQYLEELNKRIATGRVKEGVDVVLNTEGTYGSK